LLNILCLYNNEVACEIAVVSTW